MKYLTFSYDDGVKQDIRLIELFKKYGMKGTFNLNSGSLGNKGPINHMGFTVPFDKVTRDEVKDVYKAEDGIEVAVHGVCHKNLDTLDEKEFEQEILCDRLELEQLWGHPIIGGAYACGRYDDRSDSLLQKCKIYYYRTIKSTNSFEIPENFNYWHPTCHDNDEGVFELAQKFIDSKSDEDMIFYIWGHAFELDKNDKDRWANMERLCSMLAFKDDIKYCTNGEIFNIFKGKKM